MDAVLEYTKVSVITQYYANDQLYAKATGGTLDHKDTSYAWHRSATAANTSMENIDWTFTLDGKFYLIKVFIQEEIYLGKLP